MSAMFVNNTDLERYWKLMIVNCNGYPSHHSHWYGNHECQQWLFTLISPITITKYLLWPQRSLVGEPEIPKVAFTSVNINSDN